MNTTVSNVKKEIVVSFSKNEVEKKMKYLCTNSEYYKSFDDTESVLGLYKYYFKKPISGLVDTGMQVHISLIEDGDSKTKINIEVVDNWQGTEDFDIDSSNILINEVTKSLTHILSTDVEKLEQTNIAVIATEKDKGLSSGAIWTIIAIAGLILLYIILC